MTDFALIENKSYITFINHVYSKRPEFKVVYYGDFYWYLVSMFSCIVNSVDFELYENLEISSENIEESKLTSKTSLSIFLNDVKNSKSRITIFTSGTTSVPKRVTHLVKWFIQNAIVSENLKFNVWGMPYNPTHMAGLQVIFQAILNLNQLNFWFKKERTLILEQIEKNNVTNISGTPTFYKLLQPFTSTFDNVKRITIGGERSTEELIVLLKKVFPNSKVNNIYATTEFGSLLISDGDKFIIPDSKRDKIRIVDSSLQVLVEQADGNSKWMDTGDIVEVASENPLMIRFTARNISFVNIGGERVNLEEIEDTVYKLPYVKLCRVFVKKSSVLDFISLEVVLQNQNDVTAADISKSLKEIGLINGRCPQIIKIVSNIDFTRTGKVTR